MFDGLEEEPEPEEEPAEAPASPVVPSVAPTADREFEFRTESITAEEILDGKTLADRLTTASTEGWDLVDILQASGRHAILLRRPKRVNREARPVGFAPPPRASKEGAARVGGLRGAVSDGAKREPD